MQKLFVNSLLICFVIFIYTFLFASHHFKITCQSNVDSLLTVKLSFVGDIMCHLPQLQYARINIDSFDFKPTFRFIKKYLDNADLIFGNLETVIGNKNEEFTGYPNFNSPLELIEALKYAGFDVLFTSNNHSFDHGIKGIVNTLNTINRFGIMPVGTFIAQKDFDSLRIINKNDIKIGLVAFTYGVNYGYLPINKNYIIKIIDTTLIKNDIKKLKEKNVDMILIYFHFGEEYNREPSDFQKMIVEKTIEYGADLIIASHPHVIQPIIFFESKNSKIKKGLIAYSLGNFLSNQRWRYSDAGVILNIIINKNKFNEKISIDSVSIIPTWIYKGIVEKRKEFLILPCDSTFFKNIPSFLSSEDIKKMQRSYSDTYKMFLPKN